MVSKTEYDTEENTKEHNRRINCNQADSINSDALVWRHKHLSQPVVTDMLIILASSVTSYPSKTTFDTHRKYRALRGERNLVKNKTSVNRTLCPSAFQRFTS